MLIKYFAGLLSLFLSCFALGNGIPENAHKNSYNSGWSCDNGYYKSGNQCLKIIRPGTELGCKRGFYRSGNECKKVVLPENSTLNLNGNGWVCERGYLRSGNNCVEIQIPKNGRLNFYGTGWDCISGYKKSGSQCIKMTSAEVQKQEDLQQKIMKELQKRKSQGGSGDYCVNEYKTNAEICIEVTSGDLDCNEDFFDNYYSDCDATINYVISTDYSGGAYIDADIECTVEIEYTGRGFYFSGTDSDSDYESHSLFAHSYESHSFDFNFSFSPFDEVTSVKISSGECTISDVNLW